MKSILSLSSACILAVSYVWAEEPVTNGTRAETEQFHYQLGDQLSDDYELLEDIEAYGLEEGRDYAKVGDDIFEINTQTREIVAFIGSAEQLSE
jgi:hypothetical protein